MGLGFFVCLTLDCLSHIFKPLHPFIKQYTFKKKVCKIKKAPNLGETTCKREKKKLQAKKE